MAVLPLGYCIDGMVKYLRTNNLKPNPYNIEIIWFRISRVLEWIILSIFDGIAMILVF